MLGNHFKKIGVQLPWIIVAAGCCLALSRNLRLRQLFLFSPRVFFVFVFVLTLSGFLSSGLGYTSVYIYGISRMLRAPSAVDSSRSHSHLAALRGGKDGRLAVIVGVLQLMLVLVHVLLVLADAVMVLPLLPLAHVVDERPLLVLLAEWAVLAHLLLGLYLLALFCNGSNVIGHRLVKVGTE